MCVERGIGDGPPEIGVLSLLERDAYVASIPSSGTTLGEMLLGEAEVDHEHLVLRPSLAHYEVGRLDVAMNVSTLVQSLDCVQHLDLNIDMRRTKELTRRRSANSALKSLPFCFLIVARFFPAGEREINTKHFHHDEVQSVRLRALHEVIDATHVWEAYPGFMKIRLPWRFLRTWYSKTRIFLDLSAFSTLSATHSFRTLS